MTLARGTTGRRLLFSTPPSDRHVRETRSSDSDASNVATGASTDMTDGGLAPVDKGVRGPPIVPESPNDVTRDVDIERRPFGVQSPTGRRRNVNDVADEVVVRERPCQRRFCRRTR